MKILKVGYFGIVLAEIYALYALVISPGIVGIKDFQSAARRQMTLENLTVAGASITSLSQLIILLTMRILIIAVIAGITYKLYRWAYYRIVNAPNK